VNRFSRGELQQLWVVYIYIYMYNALYNIYTRALCCAGGVDVFMNENRQVIALNVCT